MKPSSLPHLTQHVHKEHGILFIDNQPREIFEGSSIPQVEEWFDGIFDCSSENRPYRHVCVPEKGLPNIINEDVIIVGGSSKNLRDNLLWMEEVSECIRILAHQKKKILGLCFGHQIVNHALGGKVEKGSKGMELGIYKITLNEEGEKDPLFRDLPSHNLYYPEVHGECVTELATEIPAKSLAHSEKYPYQAIAIGDTIRTMQFHPEISTKILRKITEARKQLLYDNNIIQSEKEYEQYQRRLIQISIREIREQIFENFFKYFVLKKED